MEFASRTAVLLSTLNVAAPSMAGVQLASEEALVVVITLRLLLLAHQDQDMEVHQQDQAASAEAEASEVDSRVAVVVVDSEEVSTAHAVEVDSVVDLMVLAAVVEAMEEEAVAASDTSRMDLVELQTAHQPDHAADVAADLAVEDFVIAHNLRNANRVLAVAIVSLSDHEEEGIATAMASAAVVLEAEMEVDATIPLASAHTMETDTVAAETREGTESPYDDDD